MRRWFVFLPLLLLLALPSCANVKQVEDKASIEVPTDAKTVPIRMTRIVNDVRRGTVIGEIRFGLLCIPGILSDSTLYWGQGRGNMSDDEFSFVFRDELRSAGYDVVNNRANLFDDREDEAARARLSIGAAITDIKANVCFPKSGWGSSRTSGDSYIKVRWQIQDRFTKQIVYETTTEGTGSTPTSLGTTYEDIILAAFTKAARNLMADPGFHELIVRTGNEAKPEAESSKTNQRISIPAKAPYRNGFQQNLDAIRDNVFLVREGRGGHGSGFFIAPGWGLTNYHVVGEADEVGIRAKDGKIYAAQVVSRHRGRDVALLKIAKAKQTGIPVNLGLPKVGSDVVVIGSPASEEYQDTVTKGIVSSIRSMDVFGEGKKQPVIQADAAITGGNSGGVLLDANGNAIGITVAAARDANDINLFIPIADGLKQLNVRYGGGGSYSPTN
jgi:serine protease Do